jgi:hypothetical protein
MNNWVIICILLVVLVVATITEKPRILEGHGGIGGLTGGGIGHGGRGIGHGGGIRYVGGGGGGYEVNPILFGYPYYYGYYYYPYYLFFTDASD